MNVARARGHARATETLVLIGQSVISTVTLIKRCSAFRVCVSSSYEALRSVVHDAELKPLLVLEGFGERAAERVGRQNFVAAVLELSKDALWNREVRGQ